jgi:UDP-galactopyranose mutase
LIKIDCRGRLKSVFRYRNLQMSSTPLPGDDYQVTSVLNWRLRVHDTAAMKSFKKICKDCNDSKLV